MDNIFFVEEHVYQSMEVPESLIRKQFFVSYGNKNEYKLKVTGLSIVDEKTYFFLPKNTNKKLSINRKIELGKMALESILKYRNENRLSSEEEYWIGKKNSKAELFDTVDWLINDYKKHGIYIEEEIYKSKDTSNAINWNKTIKKTRPLIIDQQVFYPDLITYSKRTNHNSVLTAIHNNIILEITNKYGWLFDVSKRRKFIEVNFNLKQMLIFLKGELDKTTNTRTQILIINMLTFLTNLKLENETFDMVTPYFQNVWEDAIKKVFNHNTELQSLVGKPYWKLKNGDKKESNQFPDVLIDFDGTLIIIDAKYYSIDEALNNNLPGWSSIVKQMYYNLSLGLKYKSICNFFLIPKYSIEDKVLEYIGYASVGNYEKDFGLVYAFNLNTELLLNNYLAENIRTDLTDLLLKKIGKS